MSKVYNTATGQRHCDGCWKNPAITKRKVGDCWYMVCAECAKAIDQQKEVKSNA